MAILTILGALSALSLTIVQGRSWYDDDNRYYGNRGYYGYGISGFGRGRGIGIGIGGRIGGYLGGFQGSRGRLGGRRGDLDDFEFEREGFDFDDIGDRFDFDDDNLGFRRGFGGLGRLRGGGFRRRGFGGYRFDYDDIFDDGFGRYRGFGGRFRNRRGFGKFPGYGNYGYGRYHGYSVDSPKSFNSRFLGNKNTYYDGGALNKYTGNYYGPFDIYDYAIHDPEYLNLFIDYTDKYSYPDYLKQYFESLKQATVSEGTLMGSDMLHTDFNNMGDSSGKYTEYSGKSDDSGKSAADSGKYPSYLTNKKYDHPKVKKKY